MGASGSLVYHKTQFWRSDGVIELNLTPYTPGDCIPITTDTLEMPIRWNHAPPFPDTNTVRFTIRLQHARLYALTLSTRFAKEMT